MNIEYTRRDALKAITASGTVGTIIPGQTGATPSVVRVVETGIRYDLEIQDRFSRTHLDSRPPFTINNNRKELILARRSPSSLEESVLDGSTLVDQQPIKEGQSTTVKRSGTKVGILPTTLSDRMHPMMGVSLSTKHHLPQVEIRHEGPEHRIVDPSGTITTLSEESERKIHLEPRYVEVTTVEITSEKATVKGVPDERVGPKREHGSMEVKATPVVKAVDHGSLVVRRRRFP